ncbi:hypothetical protein [Pseudobacteroides cellulosolvens]|uniref:Uncharacterized protein n=1 Tax=Pseudobacteroides cellulosolvens ATCC 35603 = DSM 2933 TaxID=398512 RepID=A0A0L6JIR8_9FIRM|nr:hypothetical protein [Pseudobacteroides cellulosolvens]KNY25347.1 hypothetical protein Bccel_0607 [Pseudobacteroides cellulosolvens ATCC 35603 = DSM 2933]
MCGRKVVSIIICILFLISTVTLNIVPVSANDNVHEIIIDSGDIFNNSEWKGSYSLPVGEKDIFSVKCEMAEGSIDDGQYKEVLKEWDLKGNTVSFSVYGGTPEEVKLSHVVKKNLIDVWVFPETIIVMINGKETVCYKYGEPKDGKQQYKSVNQVNKETIVERTIGEVGVFPEEIAQLYEGKLVTYKISGERDGAWQDYEYIIETKYKYNHKIKITYTDNFAPELVEISTPS